MSESERERWQRHVAEMERRETEKAIANETAVACAACARILSPRRAYPQYRLVAGKGMQPDGTVLCHECHEQKVAEKRAKNAPMQLDWHRKAAETKRLRREQREREEQERREIAQLAREWAEQEYARRHPREAERARRKQERAEAARRAEAAQRAEAVRQAEEAEREKRYKSWKAGLYIVPDDTDTNE